MQADELEDNMDTELRDTNSTRRCRCASPPQARTYVYAALSSGFLMQYAH